MAFLVKNITKTPWSISKPDNKYFETENIELTDEDYGISSSCVSTIYRNEVIYKLHGANAKQIEVNYF